MAGGETGKIVQAIQAAEKRTSAEIRVHLTKRVFDPNPLRTAHGLLERLGMERTIARNAVLIYVNLLRRKFAIAADIGIYSKMEPEFWDSKAARFSETAKSKGWEDAVAELVQSIGSDLALLYPAGARDENSNELTDEVSSD